MGVERLGKPRSLRKRARIPSATGPIQASFPPRPPRSNGSSAGRKITFPSDAAEALRFALANPRFAVRDLPGELDDESKLTLARRLIREALLAILET